MLSSHIVRDTSVPLAEARRGGFDGYFISRNVENESGAGEGE